MLAQPLSHVGKGCALCFCQNNLMIFLPLWRIALGQINLCSGQTSLRYVFYYIYYFLVISLVQDILLFMLSR